MGSGAEHDFPPMILRSAAVRGLAPRCAWKFHGILAKRIGAYHQREKPIRQF